MKPKLHRSITFWSGILVMGFICWAWWDSMHFQSGFAMDAGGRPMGIHAGAAAVAFALVDGSTATGGWRFDGFHRYPNSYSNWFPAPAYTLSEPPGVQWIVLPFWTILSLLLIAWAGLLIWRARRRKRFSTP